MDFSHDEFSYAVVDIEFPFGSWNASAHARRHPDDRRDGDLGLLLAYARAFENLAAKLRKQADGWTKHHEDVAAHAEKLKEEAEMLGTPNPVLGEQIKQNWDNSRYGSGTALRLRFNADRSVTVSPENHPEGG